MKSYELIIIFFFIMIFSGCARTYNLSGENAERDSQIHQLSDFSDSNDVIITFKDNRLSTARHLRFNVDSLYYEFPDLNNDTAIAYDRIASISIRDKKQGAIDGAGILGFCTGLLGVAGSMDYIKGLPGGPDQEDNRTLNIVLIYCVSSIPGFAVGYGVGSCIGSQKTYMFNQHVPIKK
jgi:hypothetical protein